MKKIVSVMAAAALVLTSGVSGAIAADIKGSGTVKIGSKVKPGVYVSANSNKAGCYWARLQGFSGSLDDIVASDFGPGQMIVEIMDTDKGFKSSRCGTWKPLKTLKAITTLKTNGTYQVGTQLMPGTWESNGTGTCYWARLSSFSGSSDDVIENEFSTGPQIVTIEEGDAGFKTNRCGTWTKVE